MLVKPATAFCSCTTSGMPNARAARPPGPLAKPPMPNTTGGRSRRRMAPACHKARPSMNGSASKRRTPLPRKPATPIHSIGMPALGTSTASRPCRVPIQATGTPRARSRSATARAGNTCPPVPPAMISTGRAPFIPCVSSWLGSLCRFAATAPAPCTSPPRCCHRNSSAAGSVPWSATRPYSPPC